MSEEHIHKHEQSTAQEHSHGTEACWYNKGAFKDELSSHLPFSILSVSLGLVIAGIICFFTTDAMLKSSIKALQLNKAKHSHVETTKHSNNTIKEIAPIEKSHTKEQNPIIPLSFGFLILFHLFHPAHMLFSAVATTAMFWRYEKNLLKAISIGISGSIIVCGISDIIMPYLSGLILGQDIPLHICIIEHPMLVLPFAFLGVLIGLLAALGTNLKSTLFSHSLHVFASTMASIFYIITSYGKLEWINSIGWISLFITIAVVIPCCLSDIVYPLLFTKDARKQYSSCGHNHPH